MSYARMGVESDVYVFQSVTGPLECCGCGLDGEDRFFSTKAMLDHLSAHLDAGHKVPPYCLDRLREDAEGIDAFIVGGGA